MLGLMVGAALCVPIYLCAAPGVAESERPGSLVISVSPHSSQVSLHEPIQLHLSIRNESSEEVQINLGANRQGNFTFVVTDPDGSRTYLPECHGGWCSTPLRFEGMGRISRISLAPGLHEVDVRQPRIPAAESDARLNSHAGWPIVKPVEEPYAIKPYVRFDSPYVDTIVLDDWYKVPGAGLYSIEAGIRGEVLALSAPVQPVLSGTMTVEVLPRDEERLKRVAQDLLEQVVRGSTYDERDTAAVALSYMEDPVAVPYLQQVLSGRTGEIWAIWGLRKIANADAVRALILTCKTGRTASVRLMAGSALGRIIEDLGSRNPSLSAEAAAAFPCEPVRSDPRPSPN